VFRGVLLLHEVFYGSYQGAALHRFAEVPHAYEHIIRDVWCPATGEDKRYVTRFEKPSHGRNTLAIDIQVENSSIRLNAFKESKGCGNCERGPDDVEAAGFQIVFQAESDEGFILDHQNKGSGLRFMDRHLRHLWLCGW
jgi:hypothetical protein